MMCVENTECAYVYVLRCTDGSLYCGIAKDYRHRIAEHISRSKKCAKYMRSHPFAAVEAVFCSADFAECAKIEYRFKRLSKKEKESVLDGTLLPDFLNGTARLSNDEIGDISE